MSEGLPPLQLRTKQELSDFLDMFDTASVIEFVYSPSRGKTERVVGFFYGILNGAAYVAADQDIGKYAEPFIEINLGTIRTITPYGARTPYEAAFNMPRQPKQPGRRRGVRGLKSEFL